MGSYIRGTNPTTLQMQGFLADLLAGNDLLQPMRDVVSRPSFKALQELAGSGGGALQRDALLQELARRYLPAVVDEVGQVLNGLLDLPEATTGVLVFSEAEKTESSPISSAQGNKSFGPMVDIPRSKKRKPLYFRSLRIITIIAALAATPYLIWVHLGLVPTPAYIPIPQKLLQESFNDRLLLYCLLGSRERQLDCGDIRRSRGEYRQAIQNYESAIKTLEALPRNHGNAGIHTAGIFESLLEAKLDILPRMRAYVGLGQSLEAIGYGWKRCPYYYRARDLYNSLSNAVYQSGYQYQQILLREPDDLFGKVKDSFRPQYSGYLRKWVVQCPG